MHSLIAVYTLEHLMCGIIPQTPHEVRYDTN